MRRWREGTGFTLGVRIVVVLGVLALAWFGWRIWQVQTELRDAARAADVLRSGLAAGDPTEAREHLDAFSEAADAASSHTSGPAWSVLEHVPFVGDDARGVALVSQVLADLGREGLPPIVDAAADVTATTFHPEGGTFPVAQIASLEQPAAQSEAAFDRAVDRLQGVDKSGFNGRVRDQYDELEALVTDARTTLGSTYRAARLAPKILGDEGPKNYLLVLQNNAELRSAGGLPGAIALLRTRDGRVEMTEQLDMVDLGITADPVERLTAEETAIFGRILGRTPVDATLTPDIGRASELIHAHWERSGRGRLDGMLFLDPVAISYLMEAIGTVKVPGFPAVSSANLVASLENQVYLVTDDREVHSDYQQAVARAVFETFISGRSDPVASVRALVSGVREGRIRMHNFVADEQAEIAGTAIAGEFEPGDATVPAVGVYVNDGGPTKMQYYLDYAASVRPRSCIGSTQVLSGSVDFRSDTPAEAAKLPPAVTGKGFPGQRAKPGEQLLVIYLTSPIGGQIEELRIDGREIARPAVLPFRGAELSALSLRLKPEQSARVEFVMRSARGQTGDVAVRVTPGAYPGSSNTTVRSGCGE